jgi:hypothetical protein
MQNRLFVVLGVVAIVLGVMAFVGPWWVVTESGQLLGLPFSGTHEYRPFGSTVTTQGPYPNATVTNTSGYQDAPNVGGVFLVGTVCTALGLLWGAGMTTVSLRSKSTPRQRKWGALLGILAFGYVLAGLLYVMALLPGAVNEVGGLSSSPFSGFWGSTSASGFSWAIIYTYGAGWAWYAGLGAALLFLIRGVLLFGARADARLVGDS